MLSVNISLIVGHKVSLRYSMQEGEETLLHTSMLHYITSRFFFSRVSSGNYARDIQHSYGRRFSSSGIRRRVN